MLVLVIFVNKDIIRVVVLVLNVQPHAEHVLDFLISVIIVLVKGIH